MIKTVKINITASDPNLPLARSCVYAGSAASFTVLNVPKAVGKRSIASVYLVCKNVAGTTTTYAAVRVGSAFEVTVPATHLATVGTVSKGIRVLASGSDENGVAASWVLGIGDLVVLDPSGTVTPSPSTKSEVYKEDFANVSSLSNASLNEVSAKVNQILTILKPAAIAILLGCAAVLPCAASLSPSTLFGDVPPTNTIAEVVSAGGGGGGGCDTNAVQAIIDENVRTNNLCTVAAANQTYLKLTGGNVTGDINMENNDLFAGQLRVTHWRLKGDFDGWGWIQNENESLSDQLSTLAKKTDLNAVSNTVSAWENYWTGDRVRLSVTNYYGNTSGELPRLRIEESQTNAQGVVTNWIQVWDEENRHTNYQAQVDAKVDAMSNTLMTAAFMQTANQLAGKAPRAWQTVTSAGEAAPDDTVWMTAPKTVFAGGTEYTHISVGQGVIAVLTDNGAPVVTEGEEGKFRITDDTGEYYFGFDVAESYTLGCRTDGISVDTTEQLVSLTYDLTASSNPIIYHSTNLTTWATQTVTWEQNPPAGTKVCYINVGSSPSGFYKAVLEYEGGAKFLTNMPADMGGGIMATNISGVSTAKQLPVYPVITSTGVVWRVNWGSNQ